MWTVAAVLWSVSLATPPATNPENATRSPRWFQGTYDPGRPHRLLHAVVFGPVVAVPRPGLALGYELAFGRRFSTAFRLEYLFQSAGLWHLQGVSETVAVAVWTGRPQRGFFFEGSFGLAHQFLVYAPRLSRTAIAPGLAAGFRWSFGRLVTGVSAGLRWQHDVGGDRSVCTRGRYCPSVREGVVARFTVDVGVLF